VASALSASRSSACSRSVSAAPCAMSWRMRCAASRAAASVLVATCSSRGASALVLLLLALLELLL
jgi:hypothetical protein